MIDNELEAEIAVLRADRDMLDWIDKELCRGSHIQHYGNYWFVVFGGAPRMDFPASVTGPASGFRSAIEEARRVLEEDRAKQAARRSL